jgi:DNA-binding transcriptional regulator YiaG
MDALNLKHRRKRLGLTQAELAKRMGVTWNTVARWETEQRNIPKMAAVLLGYLERESRSKGRIKKDSQQGGKGRRE